MWPVLALAAGTLVSEDAACLTAGLLIAQGHISPVEGITACSLGILIGDLGLWALGRTAGPMLLRFQPLARRLPPARLDECRRWLERYGMRALISSRFIPGSRLPLYVTAGLVRLSPLSFVRWTVVAVALWTPAIVLGSAWAAEAATSVLHARAGASWLPAAGAAGVLLLLLKASRAGGGLPPRPRVLARWRRWEFWPMWLFYAPVAVRVVWLALRHKGVSTIAAANPGIPDGGTLGESKFAILQRLPPDCTIPSALIPSSADIGARVQTALDCMRSASWQLPVVLKPDVGQRGVGVNLARTVADLHRYLSIVRGPVVMQPYHEGPFEAGVFYYRFPSWARGRILSITDKRFPAVVGDGRSTLETLILADRRLRLQASVFLRRHRERLSSVPARGERIQLAVAGNHAQGTMFLDGSELWTAALERRIDEIARGYPGFFIGRFDIRYRDLEAFKAGLDLAIVELNGALAESTNVYDPSWSLTAAYRQLFLQWELVFAIGAANREAGAQVTSTWRLLGLVWTHLTDRTAYPATD